MYEYELIQQRNISGKGVLKVPSDVDKNRAYILYCSVFRSPSQEYRNLSYNPYRSRYGQLVFLRNDYVTNVAPIEFKKQVFDGVNDVSGQTLLAVKCAYDGILESLLRLSTNLAGTPGSIGLAPLDYINLIKDYASLRLAWDECRLICYADTAINLSLHRLKYDVCNPDFDKSIAPPLPEDIPPEVPPGTPLADLSTPYNGVNDDGNTIPYLGDDLYMPICHLTGFAFQSANPGFREPFDVIVPDGTYLSVYADYQPDGGYYPRTSGSQGVITLAGPFYPPSNNRVSYGEFSNSCANS